MTPLYNEIDWRESGHDIITLYYMSLRGKWDLSDLRLLIQNSFKQLHSEVWGLYVKQIFDPKWNESLGLVESEKRDRRRGAWRKGKKNRAEPQNEDFFPSHCLAIRTVSGSRLMSPHLSTDLLTNSYFYKFRFSTLVISFVSGVGQILIVQSFRHTWKFLTPLRQGREHWHEVYIWNLHMHSCRPAPGPGPQIPTH